jgi:hypothetical protein
VKFRFPEAAIGDFTLTAISCPWRLHLNFSCQVESNGWFSAIKLIARISGPGHQQSFAIGVSAGFERPLQAKDLPYVLREDFAKLELLIRQETSAQIIELLNSMIYECSNLGCQIT